MLALIELVTLRSIIQIQESYCTHLVIPAGIIVDFNVQKMNIIAFNYFTLPVNFLFESSIISSLFLLVFQQFIINLKFNQSFVFINIFNLIFKLYMVPCKYNSHTRKVQVLIILCFTYTILVSTFCRMKLIESSLLQIRFWKTLMRVCCIPMDLIFFY